MLVPSPSLAQAIELCTILADQAEQEAVPWGPHKAQLLRLLIVAVDLPPSLPGSKVAEVVEMVEASLVILRDIRDRVERDLEPAQKLLFIYP